MMEKTVCVLGTGTMRLQATEHRSMCGNKRGPPFSAHKKVLCRNGMGLDWKSKTSSPPRGVGSGGKSAWTARRWSKLMLGG